jgi:hypothetical protein
MHIRQVGKNTSSGNGVTSVRRFHSTESKATLTLLETADWAAEVSKAEPGSDAHEHAVVRRELPALLESLTPV